MQKDIEKKNSLSFASGNHLFRSKQKEIQKVILNMPVFWGAVTDSILP